MCSLRICQLALLVSALLCTSVSAQKSRSSLPRCLPVCESIPPAKRLTSAACRSISYSLLKRTEPWSCSAAGASRAFRSSI